MTDLQAWANEHDPDDGLLWKNGYWSQISFVRDYLNPLFYSSYEEKHDNPVQVVGEHTSKSIRLPVYRIAADGLEVTLRYNFHNWVVSAVASDPVPAVFHELVRPGEPPVPSCYAEGFEHGWLHPPFEDGCRRFTTIVRGDYELWAVLFNLARALGVGLR